jgi:hypothetical protein
MNLLFVKIGDAVYNVASITTITLSPLGGSIYRGKAELAVTSEVAQELVDVLRSNGVLVEVGEKR